VLPDRFVRSFAPAGQLRQRVPFQPSSLIFSWLTGAAGVIGLSIVLIIVTLAEPIPNIVDAPIVRQDAGWTTAPVSMTEAKGPSGPLYTLGLRLENPFALVQHPEVRIRFATFGANVELRKATIEVLGTLCRYESRRGAFLLNNQMLGFVRGADCNPLWSMPSGELTLSVALGDARPIAVWALWSARGATLDQSALRVVDVPKGGNNLALVAGEYVDYLGDAVLRRADLLAHLWRLSATPFWLYAALGLSCALAIAGICLGPLRPQSRLRYSSLAWFCLAAAVSLQYATLVPPFQAPDEPDHFLSFAELAHRPDLANDAKSLAQLGHLERIKFNPEAKFRPIHVGDPYPIAWGAHVEADPAAARSGSAARLWQVLAPLTTGLDAPAVLLMLRLLNALIFAAAIAAVSASLRVSIDRPAPHAVCAVFLLVPTLAFFATHVSNYSLLMAGYIGLSAGALCLIFGGRAPIVEGALIGISLGLALSSSRSAFPVLPLVGALLAGRILVGPSVEQPRPWVAAARFWSSLALGFAGTWLIATPAAYRAYIDELGGVALQRMGASGRFAVSPWLLAGVGVACAAADGLMQTLKRSRPQPTSGTWWRASRAAAFVLLAGSATAVVLSLLGSEWIDYPLTRQRDQIYSPTDYEYIRDELQVALTPFRLRRHDLLLSSSFWIGFGWLDTYPSPRLLTALSSIAGLSLSLTLVMLIANDRRRHAVWVLVAGLGTLSSLIAYALLNQGLHGRYLIGVYLIALMLGWSCIMLADDGSARLAARLGRGGSVLMLCGAAGIHAYCLTFILQRYF
jgi:hypothetical protein